VLRFQIPVNIIRESKDWFVRQSRARISIEEGKIFRFLANVFSDGRLNWFFGEGESRDLTLSDGPPPLAYFRKASKEKLISHHKATSNDPYSLWQTDLTVSDLVTLLALR
jgi:hypothetical protein